MTCSLHMYFSFPKISVGFIYLYLLLIWHIQKNPLLINFEASRIILAAKT